MVPPALAADIDNLIRRAHKDWLQAVCKALHQAPEPIDASGLIASLPGTHNSDAAHSLARIVRQSQGLLSSKELAASIDVCASVFALWQRDQRVELLWT